MTKSACSSDMRAVQCGDCKARTLLLYCTATIMAAMIAWAN